MQRYLPSECAEHAKPFTAYVHTSRLSHKTTGLIITWIGWLKSWEYDPEGSLLTDQLGKNREVQAQRAESSAE
jgi:hypothetical protein